MRKVVLAILSVTALLLLGYSSYRSYQTWRQNHLMSMARTFALQSDLQKARLTLEELLRMNPRDIVVNRFMAELAETDQLSSTLSWRKRVVELNPHSTGDRLALAAVAVRMRDLTSATDALAGINAADRNTAAYHNMAGSLDAAASQLAAAEVHLLEAIRLEPHNSAWQLSLAVLRLHDTNAAAMVEARNTLTRLASNPTNAILRCQAVPRTDH